MGEIHNMNTARRFMLHVQGKAGPKFGRPKQKRRQLFTSFPDRWEEALSESKHAATFKVALYLLRRDWELNRGPIKVSNVALAERGVDRRQKWRALAELEALELIRVQRRPSRSPVVTLRNRS
jgi:hypothetical protein